MEIERWSPLRDTEEGCALHNAHTCSPPSLCTGKREWPAFRDWFASNLAPALTAWMGSVEVVYEGSEKLHPGSRYVFGYAPHGLFPIGASTISSLNS